jgi:hypothetical protein
VREAMTGGGVVEVVGHGGLGALRMGRDGIYTAEWRGPLACIDSGIRNARCA